MISVKEQLRYRVSQGNQMTLDAVDYKTVAYVFCESLIKDRSAAERMVSDVFSEIREAIPGLQTGSKFEAYLFIQLRNRCLAYLKTANKTQLLHSPYSGNAPEAQERMPVEPELSKARFLIRAFLRFLKLQESVGSLLPTHQPAKGNRSMAVNF